MLFKPFALIALATGFASAGPVSTPQSKRSDISNDFNFASSFTQLTQQQQVVQIQSYNLRVANAVIQQRVVQQVNQVLIVDQSKNGFNKDLNNVFRKSSYANQFQSVTTVLIVVQEITIAVADAFGKQVQQQVFAQSIQVANRGKRNTQTVMLFEAKTLVAQEVLANGAFDAVRGIGGVAGVAGATGAGPTKTGYVQLLDAKPTWSSIVADPAATLGAIWQKSLGDLLSGESDVVDGKVNEEVASHVVIEAKNGTKRH